MIFLVTQQSLSRGQRVVSSRRGLKGMSKSRLTKRVVDLADLTRGRHHIWDSELRGFGLQVEPTGTKTYIVRYRPKGLGRAGAKRFCKIGRHGDLTPEQARDLAKAILGRVAAGDDSAAERRERRLQEIAVSEELTVEQVGSLFLSNHIEPLRKAHTRTSYENVVRRHIVPRIGALPIKDVRHVDVHELHLCMKETPSAANRAIAVLSSMFSFAARRGLVAEGHNPARGIEKYRERSRERYLSRDELRCLGDALAEAETIGLPWTVDLGNPNSKHLAKNWQSRREAADLFAVAAIRLLLFTGARLREILHLEWSHVDIQRGLLFLPDSKTGKKTIVLNSAALEVLAQLRQTVAATLGTSQYVIRSEAIDRPRADLNRPWRAVRHRAGLDDMRLHDLRHTFASIGAGASLGLPMVGKLLGHSQPQTTARYAHLDADPLRRAANVIGDQLTAALGARPTKADERPN